MNVLRGSRPRPPSKTYLPHMEQQPAESQRGKVRPETEIDYVNELEWMSLDKFMAWYGDRYPQDGV